MIYKTLLLSCTIVALNIFSFSLHSMYLADSDKFPLVIALNHDSSLFCHSAICAIALVDKAVNQTITQAGDARKNLLMNFIADKLNKDFITPIVWHVNKSACAIVELTKKFNKYNRLVEKLHLRYVHLSGEGCVDMHTQECSSFESSIPRMTLPHFNENGDACFYGGCYDNIGNLGHVIEYSLGITGKKQQFACIGMLVNTSRGKAKLIQERLFYIRQFPYLMKAFLNSTIVEKKEGNKLCYLAGVKLPPNFKESDDNTVAKMYTSFEGLPKNIKDPICVQYEKQVLVV